MFDCQCVIFLCRSPARTGYQLFLNSKIAIQVFASGEDIHQGGYANRILQDLLAEPNSKREYKMQKDRNPIGRGLFGAATQIRTGDLILTKDVLYQLSHSSISQECFPVTQSL